MASISSSVSSVSSIRGYGGLVSGLDRDSLIEGMTTATRAKIAKQQKQKQTYLWKQEAYRSISSKLVEFSQKYTSYVNQSTNISSPSFWAKSSITAIGDNSKYISVSGSSSLADSMSIVGVKQLAKDASAVSKDEVTDSVLSTGNIDLKKQSVSTLEGQSLDFKYGNKVYSVSLSSGTTSDDFTYDYSTGENAKASITRALKNVSIGNGKTLADVIQVETESDGNGSLSKVNFKSTDNAGNTIQITGGSVSALRALGLGDLSSGQTITSEGLPESIRDNQSSQTFNEKKTFLERTAGKKISFTYNGTTKSITLNETELRKAIYGTVDGDIGTDTNTLPEAMENLAGYIQKELEKQFGEGRIKVSSDGDQLNFETTIPQTGDADKSSILSISSADFGVIGKSGALNVSYGESNRLNLSSSLKDSGLKTVEESVTGDTPLELTINGQPITGLTYNSTINEIINKINSSDAGVTVSYMKSSDKFSIKSTMGGASGRIELEGDGAEALFGKKDESNGYAYTSGQDAIVSVKYAGSSDPMELVRGSNSFNLDGLNITINGEFGYDAGGNVIEGTQAVTFNAKTDSDKIVSAISDMIKDYNEIIKLVNDEVTTKPNRSYEPLTDEQKEEMTEDQITKWEEKAKAGMLFNDSDLRGLSDSMRFIFESGSEDKAMLESFGISSSSNYGDNGKLVFDETKFRAALESNAEDLQKLFTRTADTATGDKGGVMARLTTITEKYASTTGATKGILIERAGSVYAPTSILSNYLQKSIDSVNDYIDRLQDQLSTETDRYVKQFTTLESLISQMNSQSSWLSSFGS